MTFESAVNYEYNRHPDNLASGLCVFKLNNLLGHFSVPAIGTDPTDRRRLLGAVDAPCSPWISIPPKEVLVHVDPQMYQTSVECVDVHMDQT